MQASGARARREDVAAGLQVQILAVGLRVGLGVGRVSLMFWGTGLFEVFMAHGCMNKGYRILNQQVYYTSRNRERKASKH